ncbi:hypothetical protein [Oceanicola sp. 502str15]|uniref:hypothetical protein n=1 Tax=Oceanicola sp. 502str15 TaxID=2696061 RepID=UPI002094359A|nr:hypothetical protein [Oceanicola sp. 502str15]MCO6383691.1 hypothetical protein [Oceanicola sp. 502str15]
MSENLFWAWHMPYRLMRLRRRIVAFSALPLLGAAASVALHPGTAPLGDPLTLVIIMALWTGLVVWHHATFPGGWTEALPMTVMFTALLATTGGMALPAEGPALMDPQVQWQILRFLLTFLAGTFLLVWLLPTALVALPNRTFRTRHSTWAPVAPELLEAAMVMRPGETKGHHRCGQPDADGFFPVWFTANFPDDETFEPCEREMGYKARVVEEADGGLLTQCILPESGSSSVAHQRFIPEQCGTRYEIEEVHDNFNHFTRLLFWLDDAQEDYVTAFVDEIEGHPPRAIKLQVQDMLLSRLAGWMVRNDLAGPNAGKN